MITPISAVPLPATSDIKPAAPSQEAGAGSFGSMLESYIGRVQQSQDTAHNSINDFLGGGAEELHSVALKTQRAELEFQMFLQVRNKVVDAYQEIMKMQM